MKSQFVQELINQLERDLKEPSSHTPRLEIFLLNDECIRVRDASNASYSYGRLKTATEQGSDWVTIQGDSDSYICLNMSQISFFQYWI